MQLGLPRPFDSNDFAPRCGSTLQVIVSDLCGDRRCHTFSASATLERFHRTLALSRGIEVSHLITVHRGAIMIGAASQTLLSLGLTDGSTVHAFAREPVARPSGFSAAEPPATCVRSAWQLGSAPGLDAAPQKPRAASFLSSSHTQSLPSVDIGIGVGWVSWSRSQALQTSACDDS